MPAAVFSRQRSDPAGKGYQPFPAGQFARTMTTETPIRQVAHDMEVERVEA